MVYIVLCILSLIYNYFVWIKIVEHIFEIRKNIKYPYLIGFGILLLYYILKVVDVIDPDYFSGIFNLLLETFCIVLRIIIIKILFDIDIKKNVVFVSFQYFIYTICKSFAVVIAMEISLVLHYDYDSVAVLLSVIQVPLSYYVALKCYLHVVDKYQIYANKYFIITFVLLILGFFCEEIWDTTLLFIVIIIFCFITLYSIQRDQEKYRKSLLIKKQKDMMIAEYQKIEEEQLKLRKQKHDFQNHLYTIQMLLENQQRQEALAYIEKYTSKIL